MITVHLEDRDPIVIGDRDKLRWWRELPPVPIIAVSLEHSGIAGCDSYAVDGTGLIYGLSDSHGLVLAPWMSIAVGMDRESVEAFVPKEDWRAGLRVLSGRRVVGPEMANG